MARKSGRTREGRRWVRDAGVGRICSPTDVTFRTGNSGEAQALRTEKARTLVEEARRRGPVKKREMVLSREEKHRQGWPVPRGERGQGPPLVRRGSTRFLSPSPADTGDAALSGCYGWGQQLCPQPLDARTPLQLSPDNKHVPRQHPVSPGA